MAAGSMAMGLGEQNHTVDNCWLVYISGISRSGKHGFFQAKVEFRLGQTLKTRCGVSKHQPDAVWIDIGTLGWMENQLACTEPLRQS